MKVGHDLFVLNGLNNAYDRNQSSENDDLPHGCRGIDIGKDGKKCCQDDNGGKWQRDKEVGFFMKRGFRDKQSLLPVKPVEIADKTDNEKRAKKHEDLMLMIIHFSTERGLKVDMQ